MLDEDVGSKEDEWNKILGLKFNVRFIGESFEKFVKNLSFSGTAPKTSWRPDYRRGCIARFPVQGGTFRHIRNYSFFALYSKIHKIERHASILTFSSHPALVAASQS